MLPSDVDLAKSSLASIYSLYVGLTESASLDAGHGLGGNLVFAGNLDTDGRELLFAANIAGAASLAASADVSVQRQAIRDGVVDFLVTSLEEALRILKNEVRKRQAVSVAVGVDVTKLCEAMLDRGVLPDLLPPESFSLEHRDWFLEDGARSISMLADSGRAFVTWSVDREFVRWLPKLDACVQSVIPVGDLTRQRWLRLAPRYLGRMAQRLHGVALDAIEVDQFREAAAKLIALYAESGDYVRLSITS